MDIEAIDLESIELYAASGWLAARTDDGERVSVLVLAADEPESDE